MVVRYVEAGQLDRIFGALADATRRDILERSIVDDLSVSTLAEHYTMSFAAVQKHVTVLEKAGLVTKRRRGREQLVRSNRHTIRTASRLLDQIGLQWQQRIDRIDDLLADPERKE